MKVRLFLLVTILTIANSALAQQADPEPRPIPVPVRPGWLTDPKSKCSVWEQAPQPNESIVWTGGCKDGLADGNDGILHIMLNGKLSERYIGDYRKGKKNGHGTYVWANRDRYEGEWQDDLQNGKGTMIFGEGGRYVGQWKDGKPEGQGAYTSREVVYKGTWTRGCFRDGARKAAVGTTFEECKFK